MTQVIISFVFGYFATIKINQICTLNRKQSDKRHPELEYPSHLDSDIRSSQEGSPLEHKDLWLTMQQLTAYNGLHENEPIYTALNGKIYDLSSLRGTFSQSGIYSLLAGCNANKVLNIACGSMGVCTDDVIQRWEQSLSAEFEIIGYLIDNDVSEDDTETEVDNDMTTVSQNSQEMLDSASEA